MQTSLTLTEQQQALQTEYEQRKERVRALTDLTLQTTDGGGMTSPPTPTQEENDLLALGLMHPDDKAQAPQDKGMPPLSAQQAYLRDGTALPTATTSTTAARTTTTSTRTTSTSTTGASGATGA